MKSCVEYDATPKYSQKPPRPASFLFVLDLSISARKTEYLISISKAIRRVLADNTLWSKDSCIGFIGVHKNIELIDLSKKSTPHIYTIHSTLKEVIPLPFENFLLPIKEATCLDSFLNSLPTLFNFDDNELCLNEALCLSKLIFKANGGKMLLFVGAHDLTKIPQLNPSELTGSKDGMNKLMLRTSDYYQQLAQYLCIELTTSVDIYAIGNSYINLNTLGDLSHFSSGSIKYFNVDHNGTIDGFRLRKELITCMAEEFGLDAYMRVRVSKGYNITSIIGNFNFKCNDLLVVPHIGQ